MDDRLSESKVFGQPVRLQGEGTSSENASEAAADLGGAASKPEAPVNEPNNFDALRTGDRKKVAAALASMFKDI